MALPPGTWNIGGWGILAEAGRARSRTSVAATVTSHKLPQRYKLDMAKLLLIGHSAGGELALCLAGHEPSIKRVISLAGVVDLQQAWELHLSDNAVVGFLGGGVRVLFPNTITKPIPCS